VDKLTIIVHNPDWPADGRYVDPLFRSTTIELNHCQ